MYAKANLYSSALKLLKLVYTPQNVFFSENTYKFLFFHTNVNIEKKKEFSFQLKQIAAVFVFFLQIVYNQ